MINALILRFRDFTTVPGGTIMEHKAIAANAGNAYWGWWAKQHEQLPNVFLRYDKTIEVIYLFDSGQKKLFKCCLSNIESNEQGTTCPDPIKCPSYYIGKSCKAWLQLSDFDEVENVEQELHKYSYDSDNNSLFKGETHQEFFSDFFNKQVSSLDELYHQERTIWFLQPFNRSHRTETILLTNAATAHPQDFTKTYKPLSTNQILWVSDLHYSNGEKHHQFNGDKIHRPLKEHLSDFIRHSDSPMELKAEALISSGDMTFKGSKEEFREVEELYHHLASTCQLDKFNIGFCPGNHDISFADDLKGITKKALEEYHRISMQPNNLGTRESLKKEYWDALKAIDTESLYTDNYKEHFQNVTSAKSNEYLSMGRKFLMNHQRPVDICFLNSNTVQQYRDVYQGHGFVSEAQRANAEKEMGWKGLKAFGAIRIVVLHHNLIPVEYSTEPTYGTSANLIYDAQATIKWCIKNNVDVVLHGHTHQRSVTKLSQLHQNEMRDLWIVGLGSTGVSSSYRVPEHPNQFGVLDFSSQYVKINFYKIVDNMVENDGDGIELI
jgi:predicted phosphodiesterase